MIFLFEIFKISETAMAARGLRNIQILIFFCLNLKIDNENNIISDCFNI